MRYGRLSPFLQPQVLFTTNEPQSYVFGGRNHPLHSTSQRLLLEKYAVDNGFENAIFLAGNGYSGTNFERPSWKKVFEMIEADEAETFIVKDMSCLGCEYLQVYGLGSMRAANSG